MRPYVCTAGECGPSTEGGRSQVTPQNIRPCPAREDRHLCSELGMDAARLEFFRFQYVQK